MPLERKIVSKRHMRRMSRKNGKRILHNIGLSQSKDSNDENLSEPPLTHHIDDSGFQDPCHNNHAVSEITPEADVLNLQSEINVPSTGKSPQSTHTNEIFVTSKHTSFQECVALMTSHAESDGNDDAISILAEDGTSSFGNKLRTWACENNISQKAINEILRMLRPTFPFLPLTARTLLQTPNTLQSFALDNGQMFYLGILEQLRKKLESDFKANKRVNEFDNTIQVDFNIDGIPLFKSSSTEFWPILGRSPTLVNDEPFVVAIFCGTGKPQPLELYLRDLIKEINLLDEIGVTHNNRKYLFKVRSFLCDCPARSMLKMVKGHTSKQGCERCSINAIYRDRKLFYPVHMNCIKRTDNDFRLETVDSDHIKGKSPLLKANIGLVSQFPLDIMHLLYLGIVKRLLAKRLVLGPRKWRLSKGQLKIINAKISEIRQSITHEFARKPRTLIELKRWKATEFRTFLLYYGPIVMHDVLDKSTYNHFILLHCAATILSNEVHISKYLDVAQKAIELFVSQCATIYGQDFVVYNVHSLYHICDDVKLYGPLEGYSCFPFENYLGKLKRLVRAKRLPLQQIYNRIAELESSLVKDLKISSVEYIPRHVNKLNSSSFACKSLDTPRFRLSIKRPDNVVAVGGRVCIIKSIVCVDGEYKCVGEPFKYLRDLYDHPINSSELGVYFAKGHCNSITFLIKDISHKFLHFPFKDGCAVFPILHEKEK